MNLNRCRGTLEGERLKPGYKTLYENPLLKFSGLFDDDKADLKITVHLYSNGKSICSPKQTSYKSFNNSWR